MWLLPWEKLHPAILGPLMVLLGAVLLFHTPHYSWDQFKGGLTLLIGIGVSIHGVRKLKDQMQWSEESIRAQSAKRIADASAPPDYANYTEAQLRQVLNRIDRVRFPERVAEIEARLRGFENARNSSDA